MSPDHLAELHALIAFYTEAGVDAVLDEQPVDRFVAVAPRPTAVSADALAPIPAAGRGASAHPSNGRATLRRGRRRRPRILRRR